MPRSRWRIFFFMQLFFRLKWYSALSLQLPWIFLIKIHRFPFRDSVQYLLYPCTRVSSRHFQPSYPVTFFVRTTLQKFLNVSLLRTPANSDAHCLCNIPSAKYAKHFFFFVNILRVLELHFLMVTLFIYHSTNRSNTISLQCSHYQPSTQKALLFKGLLYLFQVQL